jgi:hypothetical protein
MKDQSKDSGSDLLASVAEKTQRSTEKAKAKRRSRSKTGEKLTVPKFLDELKRLCKENTVRGWGQGVPIVYPFERYWYQTDDDFKKSWPKQFGIIKNWIAEAGREEINLVSVFEKMLRHWQRVCGYLESLTQELNLGDILPPHEALEGIFDIPTIYWFRRYLYDILNSSAFNESCRKPLAQCYFCPYDIWPERIPRAGRSYDVDYNQYTNLTPDVRFWIGSFKDLNKTLIRRKPNGYL